MLRAGIALLTAVLTLPARAQLPETQGSPRPETRPSAPADFSPAGLARRVEALRADVEAALGDSFGGPIVVRVASPFEVERLFFEELTIQQSAIKGGPRGGALRRQVAETARILATATFAKVDATAAAIHVIPASFRHYADLYSTEDPDEVLGQDLLDVVLAHEMTHVFQHRKSVFTRFLAPRATSDELICRGAVLEGHADFIARKVAARRGLTSAFDLYRRLQETVPTLQSAGERTMSQLVIAFFKFQYVEGERFVAGVSAELGEKAARERLFAEPPRSQREVARPSEYLRPKAGRPDLAAIAERVREITKARGWKASVTGLPSGAFKQLLAPLGPKAVDEAMSAFVEGKALARTTSKGRAESTIEALLILTADSPESAEKLLEAQVALLAKKDEMARSGAFGSVELVSSDLQRLPWGRPAVWFSKSLFLKGCDVTTSGLIVASGELMWDLEVIVSKMREGATPGPASRSESGPAPESRPDPPLGSRESLVEFLKPLLEVPESVPARRMAAVEPTESRPSERVVRVAGTVRVGEIPPKAVTVRLWDVGEAHAVVELRGTGAKFEGDVPAGPCRIGRIVADGHDHDELVGDVLEIKDGEPVELELDAPDVIPVVVRDAISGEVVPGARVHRVKPGYSRFRGLPVLPSFDLLEGPVIVADAAARAEVPRKLARFRDDRLYVEADGHAWKEVELPKRAPSEGIEVELQRAGSLAVRVPRWSRLGPCSLRMARLDDEDIASLRAAIEAAASRGASASRPSDGLVRLMRVPKRATLPEPDRDGRVAVSGLEAGAWAVMIERGKKSASAIRSLLGSPGEEGSALLAARIVTISSGAEAAVEIDAPPIADAVPFRCRIAIPKGWLATETWQATLAGDDDLAAGFDETFPLSGDEQSVELRVARLTPGRYRVRLEGAGWEAPVEVAPPAGDVTIELPAPWLLTARVESAATSRPVANTDVEWWPVPSGRASDRLGDDAPEHETIPAVRMAESFKITAASRRVRVRFSAPGYASATRFFDTKPGGSEEVVIRLEKAEEK